MTLGSAGGLLGALTRRKIVSEETMADTGLARVLGLVDLCGLAIGSTLGLGIYVLAGDVAKHEAGPAVVISFLVAAVASLFAALCYAEFAARVPKAGSAYVYSYVCVGEFIAFVIGWNLILEYIIGTASVARGYSSYVDSIFNSTMQHAFEKCCAMHVDFLSGYPDFFAFSLVLMLSVLLAVGVRQSTRFNNVFTFCNLIVVVYVIVCGLFKADIQNWKIDPASVVNPENNYSLGSGGFFPFGFSGVMAGAARCFYGFVGFDAVATTGEEAKNPQRFIPLSIVIGLTVICFSYFGVSAVLTLMLPYYLQDDNAPLPYAFEHVGWESARWIVTIGALFGLSSSLLGALFPLPRILYAMANDGLIFRSMANIHPRFKTPFWSTLLAGLFAALMASMFNLPQLVDMMSIGTLLAYSLVAVCVLVLRYRDQSIGMVDHAAEVCDELPLASSTDHLLPTKQLRRPVNLLLNWPRLSQPTRQTASLVNRVTMVYGVATLAFDLTIVQGAVAIMNSEWWALTLTAVLGAVMLACIVIVFLQPQSKAHLFFKVPLVPFLPMLSVFVNIYLMMKLSSATWIRFGVWMAIGLAVYFGYGVWYSCERRRDGEVVPLRPSEKRTSRPSQLALNLNLPTITVQPATPLTGSASASPSLAARAAEPSEPSELLVETAPDSIRRPTASVDVQEQALMAVAQFVRQQRGLHQVIAAVLRGDTADSGRGRQLALVQSRLDDGRLRVTYLAAPPAAAQYSDDVCHWAGRDVLGHQAICRCLGAPSDGTPRPIRVSAQVHSEDPSVHPEDTQVYVKPRETSAPSVEPLVTVHAEVPPPAEESTHVEHQLAAMQAQIEALLSGGAADELRRQQLLEEHTSQYSGPDDFRPPLPQSLPQPEQLAADVEQVRLLQQMHRAVLAQLGGGEDTEGADLATELQAPDVTNKAPQAAEVPGVTVEAGEAAAHRSICECLTTGWIDLGMGAKLADEQHARYANAAAPATQVFSPPADVAAPLTSPAELVPMDPVLAALHAGICDCLTRSDHTTPPSTPPNTPTGGQRERPSQLPPGAEVAADRLSLPRRSGRSGRVLADSGFTSIPPQPPDSPFAKRVGAKFVIIPVDGDGTDSEREEDASEGDAEVRRAIRAVQDEVRTVLARAEDEHEHGHSRREDEDEAIPIPDDEQQQSCGGSTPLCGQPSEHCNQSADAPSESPAKRSAELHRLVGAAVSQSRFTSPIADGGQLPENADQHHTAAASAEPSWHERMNQNLETASPEPSMKEKLDQIIKQAVEKAARRVTEGNDETTASIEDSGSGPDEAATAASEPVPPSVNSIGDGMHRVRSKKGHAPRFDMNEMIARFEKK